MTSRDLIYWLQGLMELGDPKTLNEKQVDLIKKHLAMVFIHEIDPSFPEEQQNILSQTHAGIGLADSIYSPITNSNTVYKC